MGAGASTLNLQIKKYIQNEFDRVRKISTNNDKRDYLTLDDMFLLQHPPIMPIDFTHLGTLFVIDKNLDGKFTLQDLYTFAELCESKRKVYEPHEFLVFLFIVVLYMQSKMQGLCTYLMWYTCVQQGQDVVEKWLFNCVYLNGPVRRFDSVKDVAFIHRDNILPLYKVLRIDRAYSISFHDFFDLMQNAGEGMIHRTQLFLLLENCGFDMMDEEFDDVVPESIVMYFIKTVLGGFNQMMHDVGS